MEKSIAYKAAATNSANDFTFSASLFAIASNARPTSSSTIANSNFKIDFFGLITMSTASFNARTSKPYRLAQPALDAVPVDCPTQHASHGEAHTRALLLRCVRCLRQIKDRHVRGKVPPPLLVDALEIRVLQQTRRCAGNCSPAPRAGHHPGQSLRLGASAITTSLSSTNDGITTLVGMLLAETRFHGDALASLGPAARQHLGPAFGLHASPEPVLFRALAPVGLKCTFRHRKSLLLIESTVRKANGKYK